MARKPGIRRLSVRLPIEWWDEAEAIAQLFARPGIPVTVTDAFRAAIARGLKELRKDLK